MSRSTDAGHFFQTSDALATNERKSAKAKNKHGDPIKLPSKILAIQADSSSNGTVYVAEAAGDVKRVDLETRNSKKVFSQGNAPLTCLALSPKGDALFAGSWNKNIHVVNVRGSNDFRTFTGHTDFVKCLLTTSLDGKPILISGGADAAIIVWDTESGEQLHKLKGHTKSLQDFAIDPDSLLKGVGEPYDSFVLFTASSDREIRRWHISLDSAHEIPDSLEKPILAHDTSVYKLRFDSDGDLWTASADKTAKHLVRSRGWEPDTVLQHPDFVRDVVVSESLGMVVTACRDEDVRVWDLASGDLVCTYSGHYEEVTGLALVGTTVVSVSIDGTIRRWSLNRQDIAKHQEEMEQDANNEQVDLGMKKGGSLLTAEEEAELADLMDEDD